MISKKPAIASISLFLAAILWISVSGCSEKSNAAEKTANISLPTAKCETCKKTIEKALLDAPGVENAIVSTTKPKTVQVVFNSTQTSEAQICEVISKAGYDANTVKRDGAAYEKLEDCCK
ncbi:MAG TPA: heavy metal-associated domain-containing protein [Candidatus Kapabacteria bacterium]|nr:heavy metal-associated domain-containing protein [Candidatus Kapabacteria bacterium]